MSQDGCKLFVLIISLTVWGIYLMLTILSFSFSGPSSNDRTYSKKTNTINCTDSHASPVVSMISNGISFIINIILFIIVVILLYFVFVFWEKHEQSVRIASLKKNVAPQRVNNQTSTHSENPKEQRRLLTEDQLLNYQAVTDTPSGTS